MAESGVALAEMSEMMKTMLQQMKNMNEEITRLKNDRESTSKEHVAQHPSILPPPPPAMARPAVLNVEDDFEDGQYAGDNCLPHLERANEDKPITDRMDMLAREMENIKFQGPKKLNMADFMIYPGVTLPPRFKVPDMDRYDGTGCPRSHLMSVLPLLQQHSLSPEQVALLFPRSLIGVAKKWFLSLKSEEIRTLEDIGNRFVEQFSMEEGIDVTKRDLKALKQGHNDTFTSFIRRWRRKAAQMTHRLSDEEQIKIVVKNLSLQYYHHMAIQYFLDFNHLIKTGTQIEDALAKGLRSRIPSDVREGKRPVMAPKEVHNVNYVRPPPRAITEVRRPLMEQKPPRHFDPLPYSLSVALKKLLKDKKIKLLDIKPPPNPLPRSGREDQFCDYHRNTGHITDRCLALKHQIQNMIDRKELSIELPNVTRNPLPTHVMPPPPSVNVICAEESVIDPASFICAIESEGNYVWKFEEEDQWAETEKPYVLSWNNPDVAGPSNQSYDFQCEDEEKESESLYVLRVSDDEEEEIKTPYILKIEDEDLLLLNDQCDELRHVTRGGRVFKPAELRVDNPAEVARGVDSQKQKQRLDEEEDNLLNQLKKTQANVSIWGLLMASPKHRQVVLHELNSSQVSVEITPDELVGLVAMTKASKALSFSDEDLPAEGKDHTRPLKITLLCNRKKVSEVLVDNGSALNVCPLSTATTMGFGPEDFIPSEQGILAYDGTRRDVIGTLATEIVIGGETFDIEFQILDIKTSFCLLLGRPWLYKVGVIPSTLHQKLKFIRNNRVITVKGDPEPEVGQISQELVTENTRDISLTGFSVEVSAITMKEAMSEEIMFLSSTNTRVVKMMRRFGYLPGAGLGKNMQGPTERPELKASDGLFGLGYKPTRKEVQEMKSYMFKWAECRRRGLEFPMGPFSKIMNGRFRKEGADCPYYGFSEPWYDESGVKLPGLEIFFADELPADFYSKKITEAVVTEEPDSDWVENFEPELLDSLFQVEAPVIAMIGRDAPFVNPQDYITPAEGPLDNWTSQVL
ncbi:uncharacterized protein LOC143856462 isoform X2 [Tasmannia lanceolata]|uniref:uncharacterized protein LOC143856462 isoform X2 n=1 Tax=Tasmannia lanceolata TaxID=3420 RepID=UPI00406463C8